MRISLLSFVIILSGCGALKEATGNYVTSAVKGTLITEMDNLLEKRGLSIIEIKKITDSNDDGQLTREEVYGTVKDMTKDYVMLETKGYVDDKMSLIATKGEVASAGEKFFQWFLGLISLYLGKQLYSQRGDNKRDQRIALLETVVNKDLDGDGKIGSAEQTVNIPKNI